MKRVWKQSIRDGLREQPVLDLHDHLDFHWNRDAILDTVRDAVCGSHYRPRQSQMVRLEKAVGICRILQVPCPEDAVVLQTLVEALQPAIIKNQPTKNAYYSRSHVQPPSVADIDASFGYTWLELWMEFQKQILNFSKTFDYIVITDVANYFDAIPLTHLRHVLSAMGRFSETLLDFLFLLLETFAWRPDYLPSSGLGLPQLYFDAPRLLAHCFLYEADRLLHEKAADNFVRWMDDVNIGVDAHDTARRILRDLDDLLHTRGVRLNSGKTTILESGRASTYFCLRENQELSVVSNAMDMFSGSSCIMATASRQVRGSLRQFQKRGQFGYWDKVMKRYFTLFGKIGDQFLVKRVPDFLHYQPSLRDHIFRYYSVLGYSPTRLGHILHYVETQCIDDASFFSACKLIVDWKLPQRRRVEVTDFAYRLVDQRSAVWFAGCLWLFAKYGTSVEIEGALRKSEGIWRHNQFAARQVAAILPRLLGKSKVTAWMRDTLLHSGQLDALRVVSNIRSLQTLSAPLKPELQYYLVPTQFRQPYPLAKVLIGSAVLSGKLDDQVKGKLRSDLLKIVDDPWYRAILSPGGRPPHPDAFDLGHDRAKPGAIMAR